MKRTLTILLVLLAVAGGIIAVLKRDGGNARATPVADGIELRGALAGMDNGVAVTFFTTDVRCAACRRIEMLTEQCVREQYAGELSTGSLVFQAVNTDLPENKHFVDRYELVSKTVVVSAWRDGDEKHWVNLQDVWLKMDDEAAFKDYVGEAIRTALNGRP